MNGRIIMDHKNEQYNKQYVSKYPTILRGYELSMSRKTSYTKRVYLQYMVWFLDYITEKKNIMITDGSELKVVKPMDIDEYMEKIRFHKNGKEKSATYRIAQLSAINGFFAFLCKNGIINNNPCNMIEKPKDNKEHEIIIMDDNDIEMMINNIDNGVGVYKSHNSQEKWYLRDKLILVLGLTTGLRVSAMVGINCDDINLIDGYIKVIEKGNIEKKVYLGKNTINLTREWMLKRAIIANTDEEALFICNGGKRMSVKTMERIIKKMSNGKYTPHKMRATCATKLYEATGDIYLVQQQLGHKSIKNTERYAKVSEKKKIESANILDQMF